MKIVLFLSFIFFISCNSAKKEITENKSSILINNISINIPKTWKKDRKLNLWREDKTGAIINIETEQSKLELKEYMDEALKVIKRIYSYIEIERKSGDIYKYKYLDSIAEIEIEDRVMFVHTLIIDKDKLKITITIAVNKDKLDIVNKDFNYILKKLNFKR